MAAKNHAKVEFGDFQTPRDLAGRVCALVATRLPEPRCIVEPTCGVGSFLVAAHEQFASARHFVGVETNQEYLQKAALAFDGRAGDGVTLELIHEDFFRVDWKAILSRIEGWLLVVGNPPWVTSAGVGALEGSNLPEKTNFQGLAGFDAVTGKSNFDISEWMCIRLLEQLPLGKSGFALLVKTAVARKVLLHAWRDGLPLAEPAIFTIDAKRHFDASVDACLLVGQVAEGGEARCPVHAGLDGDVVGVVGYEDGELLADIHARARTATLTAAAKARPKWRSGVKHDCAKVLELRPSGGGLVNGFGESVDVEDEFLFPLQKSSDVAGGRGDGGKRVILTQRGISQSTTALETVAPQLWAYLQRHRALLDGRKSRIYRGRPRFSIFGVGDYTFAPWKVAISGLYKRLEFSLQGPVDGKPVVFDDTVYFLAFETRAEAELAHELLCSDAAREFLESFIFWDAKRPITAGLLQRLSLEKLEGERSIKRAPS